MARKTIDDFQKFADELMSLCYKHQIGIIGTCEAEATYGEITLFNLEGPESQSNWVHTRDQMGFQVAEEEGSFILTTGEDA